MNEWTQRVLDLEQAGLALIEIGRQVGLSPSAISDLKYGRTKEPRLSAALALQTLHKKRCKRKAA